MSLRETHMFCEKITKLEKERDQLKKERDNAQEVIYEERKILYDLRKAVWSLDLSDKHELEKALENNEMLSCTRPAEIWAEIDRLMGNWYPEKENNSGEISAELPAPSNVPHVSSAGKIHEKNPHPDSISKLRDKGLFDKTDIYPTDEIEHWPEED